MADDTEHSGFVQKLIDAVRERRCLYDKKHIAYFNRREREKAWRQIGQQLGRSDVDCHRRWKLLREKLAKELKKRDKALENGENFQSDWDCFDSIMFVEDHIAPRKKLEKLPLMLVKDLTKKRSLDDTSVTTYSSLEKRAYASSDFNFLLQLSKTSSSSTQMLEQNQKFETEVKSEPFDKKSVDLNSISANDNSYTYSNETTTSSIANNDIPGTLDLTKAVDVLLKDLRDKKESNLNFVKNLTDVLKIKDLDVFNYSEPSQQHLTNNTNLNENAKMSNFDIDNDSLSNSIDSHTNEKFEEKKIQTSNEFNNLTNNFINQSSASTVAKSSDFEMRNIEPKLVDAVKSQEFYEPHTRFAAKDELFGKLVTSMLADITDEECKDDAKFSIMQLLVNAKRAGRAKSTL